MTALVLLSDMLDNFALLPYSLSKYREDSTLCACRFKYVNEPYINCMAAFIVHSSLILLFIEKVLFVHLQY